MLAAVETAASDARFDNDQNPDPRKMRGDIDRIERLQQMIYTWLNAKYPDDFPDLLI